MKKIEDIPENNDQLSICPNSLCVFCPECAEGKVRFRKQGAIQEQDGKKYGVFECAACGYTFKRTKQS